MFETILECLLNAKKGDLKLILGRGRSGEGVFDTNLRKKYARYRSQPIESKRRLGLFFYQIDMLNHFNFIDSCIFLLFQNKQLIIHSFHLLGSSQ